jgi:predicted nucleotidyltransferase
MDRERIVGAIVEALETRDDVLAVWEAGSTAWGRADALSDVDLQVVVEDEAVGTAFDVVEATLARLGGIERRWEVPEPAWHGHSQRFYTLAGAPPWLFVDLVVMKRSADDFFLLPEQHGRARVLLDRAGLTAPPPFDAAALRERLRRERDGLLARFELFQVLVTKEIERGHPIDALAFYHGLTLRPLVTVLGMRYRPLRFDFGARYLDDDLPEPVARELESLYFVADTVDLAAKHQRARRLFHETVAAVDPDALDLEGASRAVRERLYGRPGG